ncbi:MAG: hypothetical protein Q4E62_09810 [Sutterellaceae bacterium]|nr:hypothetical protein [Sutterellaceae bacterium]
MSLVMGWKKENFAKKQPPKAAKCPILTGVCHKTLPKNIERLREGSRQTRRLKPAHHFFDADTKAESATSWTKNNIFPLTQDFPIDLILTKIFPKR